MGYELIKIQQKARILELAIKALDNEITTSEFEELEGYISSSKILADYYSACIKAHMSMVELEGCGYWGQKTDSSECDVEFWQEMARYEKIATGIEIPKEKPQQKLIQRVERKKVSYKLSKLNLFSLIMSAAAILFVVLFVKLTPVSTSVEVATLVDQVNVKWGEPGVALDNGDRLWTKDKPLDLRKGIVKIQYDNGVEVIVEGPAEFELLSNMEMSVNYGRLFAHISEQGKGFVVVTHNSRIIDLGTEFGIYADIYGGTELQVYKGRTTLIAGKQDRAKQVVDVLAGHAKKVSRDTGAIRDIELNETAFVRSIDSSANQIWRGHMEVDLADILCGGDGFGTGSKTAVLDPVSGKYPLPSEQELKRQRVKAKKVYCAVQDNPFIDGVFVPNGKNDRVIVSSEQHLFSRCPETSGVFNHYFSNGPFNWEKLMYYSPEGTIINALDKQSIYMHTNLGITFDLDKIRQSLPGLFVKGFEATCVRELIKEKKVTDKATFVILVDGEVKFWSHRMSSGESESVDIELSETDRFLTLITLESNDGIGLDRTYFVEPMLLLGK